MERGRLELPYALEVVQDGGNLQIRKHLHFVFVREKKPEFGQMLTVDDFRHYPDNLCAVLHQLPNFLGGLLRNRI